MLTRGHTTVSYRKFKNFDSAKFRNDISQQNWDFIHQFKNPNDMWHAWKNTFNFVVEKHAPLRTKRVKASKAPWISSHLKGEMHKRDILKIKAIRSNDTSDWLIFKKMRNSVNQNIVRAKENYFTRAFFENKCNSKKTWNIINDLTSKNRKSSHIHEVDLNGNLINDSNKIADAFNQHFSNIREVKIPRFRFTGTGNIHIPIPVNRGIMCNLRNARYSGVRKPIRKW